VETGDSKDLHPVRKFNVVVVRFERATANNGIPAGYAARLANVSSPVDVPFGEDFPHVVRLSFEDICFVHTATKSRIHADAIHLHSCEVILWLY
jgi:hypothetical protein